MAIMKEEEIALGKGQELLELNFILDKMDQASAMAKEAFDRALELLRDKDSRYPGNPLWEFQDVKLVETKYKLAEKLYSRWHKELTPNIEMDFKRMLVASGDYTERDKADDNMRKNGFVPHELFKLFMKNCYTDVEQQSRDYILKQSKLLLPHSSYQEPVKTVDEILKNNRLVLRLYGKNSYGSERNKAGFIALIKLAYCVLEDVNPATVVDIHAPFESVWFKNGRLDIKFDSSDAARKVAEVLIHGWKA